MTTCDAPPPARRDVSPSRVPARGLPAAVLVFLGAVVASVWLYRDLLALWPDGRVWEPVLRDADQFIWAMRAIPARVIAFENPFLTDAIFARDGGANLAYNTAAPGVALVAAPITALWGPTAALTVVTVLVPPVATVSAFWLLSEVAPSTGGWVRVVGALLIGFCPALLLRNGHHVNLAAVVPLVLVAGALCARIATIAGRRTVDPRLGVLLGAVVGAMLWVSTELVALAAIVAAVPFLLLIVIERPTSHKLLEGARRLWKAVLAGAASALLVSVPFGLAYLYGPERVSTPYHLAQRDKFGLPLENIVVPVKSVWPTAIAGFGVEAEFGGLPAEAVGYLSIAGVAAAMVVTLTFRSASRRLRFAILGFWSTFLLSLGGAVTVGDARWGWLPWRLIERLPLVANAIPNRLALFSFTYLVVALVLTVQSQHPPWLTRACKSLIVAIAAFVLPVVPFNVAPLDTDVVDSIATTCEGADVLVVPRDLGFGTFVGPRTMAWQAESDMRFDLVRGWAFRSSSPAEGDPLALDGLVAAPTSTDLARGEQELRALAPVCLVAPLADDDALQRAVNQPAVVQDGWRIWHIEQPPTGPDG